MHTSNTKQDEAIGYGERLLAVLRGIDDESLMTREAMRQALGFPNVGQVSQMLNQGVVPGGERVLNLLNADVPREVRWRLLSLVGGVIPRDDVNLESYGNTPAARMHKAMLEVIGQVTGLMQRAAALREDELQGGIDTRKFGWRWPEMVGMLRRARRLLDGVGGEGDEIVMSDCGRRKAGGAAGLKLAEGTAI